MTGRGSGTRSPIGGGRGFGSSFGNLLADPLAAAASLAAQSGPGVAGQGGGSESLQTTIGASAPGSPGLGSAPPGGAPPVPDPTIKIEQIAAGAGDTGQAPPPSGAGDNPPVFNPSTIYPGADWSRQWFSEPEVMLVKNAVPHGGLRFAPGPSLPDDDGLAFPWIGAGIAFIPSAGTYFLKYDADPGEAPLTLLRIPIRHSALIAALLQTSSGATHARRPFSVTVGMSGTDQLVAADPNRVGIWFQVSGNAIITHGQDASWNGGTGEHNGAFLGAAATLTLDGNLNVRDFFRARGTSGDVHVTIWEFTNGG